MTDQGQTETQTRGALHRDYPEKKLAGVCAAVSRGFSIPVAIVRLGFVLLTLFHGIGLLLYLAAVVCIPNRPQEDSLAERFVLGARGFADAFRNPPAGPQPPQGA